MAPSDDAPAIDAFDPRLKNKISELQTEFRRVRTHSTALAEPLTAEDQLGQAMPDASPTKWHLAHTSWFFETFVLVPHAPGYASFNPAYAYLFNSYYEAVGARHPRHDRGLLTRPSLLEIRSYRAHIDNAIDCLLAAPISPIIQDLVALGLAHEQQHQELILMDILNLFAGSPLKPTYAPSGPALAPSSRPGAMIDMAGGVFEIGKHGPGFGFDNESPRHAVLLRPYRLSSGLVTNGEWLTFMADGGYRRPEFWLADGWARAQAEAWEAPLYWERRGDCWVTMTLAGPAIVAPDAPVAHISFYEAAAFAAWAKRRLPTEAEWEHAVETQPTSFDQLYDCLWQWTASAYAPHPGFSPAAGAVGEYNAKFMVGQMVLKGGACVTPAGHSRSAYRNFYYPHQRWMFAGLRLAEDLAEGDDANAFVIDVIAGLSAARKRLPSKWFYDARGSALFEDICQLPEYYPTRQELSLLACIAPDIAAHISDGAVLTELGSGASLKTRLILDAAPQIAVYRPIDISESALRSAAGEIARDYPRVSVRPVVGDFTHLGEAPVDLRDAPQMGFFPGSTIGNFAPEDAIGLLQRVRAFLGPEGRLVIGVDLAKDAETLVAAYDDAQGVTAAFNMNLLARINGELGADFDLSKFAHRVAWNRLEGRMEMHLEALRSQTVTVAGRTFRFVAGETIHTENSYKHSIEGFLALASRAGWRSLRYWTSSDPFFAVFLLA